MRLLLVLGITFSAVWRPGMASAQAQNNVLPAEQQSTFVEPEEAPPVNRSGTPRSHASVAAFLQVGGSAGMAGFGAEYRPVALLGLHAGLSMFVVPTYAIAAGGFLGASAIVGPRSHKLEGALDYVHFAGDSDARFFSPLLGYRYQPERGGTFIRFHLQLLVRANLDGDLLPTAGFSVGYTR